MEYLDIVDENGNPTGEIIDRKSAHELGIWHRTAHVWIVRRKEGRLQVLLQKRCEEKDAFPGCLDISSAGHIPAGDEYIPSALRELAEELGAYSRAEELFFCGERRIGYDGVFHGKAFHDRQHTRVYVMNLDMDEDEFSIQEDEIESVRWMDFEECMESVEGNSFRHCIEMEELLMVLEGVRDGDGNS